MDADGQITIFAGRGILSESRGPVWLIGTGEFSLLLSDPRIQYAHMSYANRM